MKKINKLCICIFLLISIKSVKSQMVIDSIRLLNILPISTLDTIYFKFCTTAPDAGTTYTSSLTVSGNTILPNIKTCSGIGLSILVPIKVIFKINPKSQGVYKIVANLKSYIMSFATSSCTVLTGSDKDSLNFTVVQANGIKENEVLSNLTLSPNPSNGIVIINYKGESSFKGNYTLIDVNRKEIIKEQIVIENGSEKSINIVNLSNGFYFIRLTTEMGNSKTFKQIIIH
jgi:hypothetical protein